MCNICFFLRVRSPWSNHCSLDIGPGTVVVVGRSHKIGLVIGGNTVLARKFSNKFSQNLLQGFLSYFAWRYQDDISKKRTWPFFWKNVNRIKLSKMYQKWWILELVSNWLQQYSWLRRAYHYLSAPRKPFVQNFFTGLEVFVYVSVCVIVSQKIMKALRDWSVRFFRT